MNWVTFSWGLSLYILILLNNNHKANNVQGGWVWKREKWWISVWDCNCTYWISLVNKHQHTQCTNIANYSLDISFRNGVTFSWGLSLYILILLMNNHEAKNVQGGWVWKREKWWTVYGGNDGGLHHNNHISPLNISMRSIRDKRTDITCAFHIVKYVNGFFPSSCLGYTVRNPRHWS